MSIKIASNTNFPEPGIYHGISDIAYHALDAVSSTRLKNFKKFPAAVHVPFAGSDQVSLGSASHAYSIEGPEVFNKQYVIAPEFKAPASFTGKAYKMTGEYKERVAQFMAANIGKTVLDADQGAAVLGLDKSLRENPASARFMAQDALGELTVIWVDKSTGLLCKARIDWYIDGMPTDYKTTAQLDRFNYQILDLNYPTQAAWYSIGLMAHNLEVKAFCFLVGETVGTYRIRLGFLGGGDNGREWLDLAIEDTHRIAKLYAECKEKNEWPNYGIPNYIYSLDQLVGYDLMEEWVAPRNYYYK